MRLSIYFLTLVFLSSCTTIEVGREVVKVGAVVKTEELSPTKPQGPWAIVDSEQNLLAMYENFKTGTLKPAVVLPQEN